MELLAFISFFLGASWRFFTEVKVPGFDFSFAILFIGTFLVYLGLKWLFMMLGITAPVGDAVRITKSSHDRNGKGSGK